MQKVLFVLAISLFLCSCGSTVRYETSETVYRIGDDPSWAAKIYDDSSWDSVRTDLKGEVFWARKSIEILDKSVGNLGAQIHGFGGCEIYWDGVLIGNNGKPAIHGAPEIPGTEMFNLLIPDSLSTNGKHQLAVRITQTQEIGKYRGVEVKLDNYEALLQSPLIALAFMNLMAGAFLIAGIYYLLLYFNSAKRNLTILVFAIICLLFFFLLLIEYVKFYLHIPYPYFYTRLAIVGWLTFAIAALVPFYFALQFDFKYKWWLVLGVVIALLIIHVFNYGHYDQTAAYYSRMMWLASLVVVLHAVYFKKKGAILVFLGLLFATLLLQVLFYDFSLFFSFSVVMLFMLYLHTVAMKQLEQEHELSLITSSRLRLELLKKNIQPHFLKNTLTSLMDWVEESPKEGTKFIQALSEEFDIMNTIADQQLIPITKEIDLCKTHLLVMAYRKEIVYEWNEVNIDEAQLVPPAIFHTLLENGITHSIPINGSIKFELSYIRQQNNYTYTFKTFAENRITSRQGSNGNGFAYVKARLKESYDNCWSLSSNEMAEGGWITVLKISDK